MRTFFTGFLMSLLGLSSLLAQLPGVKMNFDDGDISGWKSDFENTFVLSAADSALRIDYTRTGSSGQWDEFNYTPPDLIDPSANPKITLKILSNVSTVVTFKPIYESGSDDWLQQSVPGDSAWHHVTYNLVNYSGTTINKIYLYLDGGSTTPKTGVVYFDDVVIGSSEIILDILDLSTSVTDSDRVELSWRVNFPAVTEYYKIYRGDDKDFVCDSSSFVDTTYAPAYVDSGLMVNHTYYYKISAVDTDSKESAPSDAAKARTFKSTGHLLVDVESVNGHTVGLYDRFEVYLVLQDAAYDNPYDPDQIDVRAVFTSPSGKIWNQFAFFDNYNSVNEWKIRFAPNETGAWSYYLTAVDSVESDTSAIYTFEAEISEHHGWIHASETNPYYFEYDDGTSFYGVGAFYPWNVKDGPGGLADLAAAGCNLWGYWNIAYDDGTVIESISSGLGKYDQQKAGRIDQLLEWSTAHDMKMMISIWPHDLISATVWATQWNNNPYNTIIEAEQFFTDSLAWEYQKKQYRYIIARWGSDRALGMYEIVNEINGTDAWQVGYHAQGEAWVGKVHEYFAANDPFAHPATASQSGGNYWRGGYNVVDVPNVHLYETGWSQIYPGNPMRSSYAIYANISQRFRRDYAKPAMMGEAGYESTYGNYVIPSDEYTMLYHNALWTCWANGNAASPLWWEFNSNDIYSPDVLAQMKAFARVVKSLDYVNNDFQRITASSTLCDAYAMAADTIGFGWMRHYNDGDIRGVELKLTGVHDTTYTVQWIDPWTGENYREYVSTAVGGELICKAPNLGDSFTDLAFVFRAVPEDYVNISDDGREAVVQTFALKQNYPNPFNPETTIEYAIPEGAKVRIRVYNLLGQQVAELVDGYQSPGLHRLRFTADGLASGVYVYVLKAGDYRAVRKMILMR